MLPVQIESSQRWRHAACRAIFMLVTSAAALTALEHASRHHEQLLIEEEFKPKIERMLREAGRYVAAFRDEDFPSVLSQTPKAVIEFHGGDQAMLAWFQWERSKVFEVFSREGAEVGFGKPIWRDDSVVIPKVRTGTGFIWGRGWFNPTWDLIALSSDRGESWTFLFQMTLPDDKLRKIIPHLPEP